METVLTLVTKQQQQEEKDAAGEQEWGVKELRVSVKVAISDEIKWFCKGSRLLSLASAPVLTRAPEQWMKAAAAPGEQVMSFCLNSYSLGSGVPIVIDSPALEAVDSAETGAEEGVVPQAPKLITWEGMGSHIVFLCQASVEKLVESRCTGLAIECQFPKAPEEPKDPKAKGAPVPVEGPTLETTARGTLDLAAFMKTGVTESGETRAILSIQWTKPESQDDAQQGESDAELPREPLSVAVECQLRLTPALLQPAPAPRPKLLTPRDIVPAGAPLQVRLAAGEDLIAKQVSTIIESVANEYLEVLAEITAENDAAEARLESPPQSPAQHKRSPSIAKRPLSRSSNRTPPRAPVREDPNARLANVMGRLFYKLNSNGAYREIRDRLRSAVSKYVSENKAAYKEQGVLAETDVLYSIVYEQVMVLVHRSLNAKVEAARQGKVSLDEEKGKLTAKQVAKRLAETLALQLALAEDAVIQGDHEKAQEIFLTRITEAERACTSACDRDFLVDPRVYIEYGLFAMSKGREYQGVTADLMRKAIEIDDSSVQALVAYAALLLEAGTKADQHSEAFLVAASNHTSSTRKEDRQARIVAHGLMSLLESRIAASQPNFAQALAREEIEVANDVHAEILVLSSTVSKCLEWNLPVTAQAVLDKRAQLLANTEFESATISRINRYNSKLLEGWKRWACDDVNAAGDLFEQASEIDSAAPDAWVLIGTSFEDQKFALAKALECWELPVTKEQSIWRVQVPESKYRSELFRLGNIYLGESDFGSAKQVFLRLCKLASTPAAWVGVGVACQCLNELDSAIEALSQANCMDRENAETWGFLSLTCQQKAQQEGNQEYFKLAELALKQALDLGLSSSSLLHQLGTAFLETGQLTLARRALESASQMVPDDSFDLPVLIDFCKVLLLANRVEEATPILARLEKSAPETSLRELRRLAGKLSGKTRGVEDAREAFSA
jgi:tetratricopeptide (TPR) repeat protein